MNENKHWLFMGKAVEIFIEVRDNKTLSDLHPVVSFCHSHGNRLRILFEVAGLISTKKKGKLRIMTLTDKGKKFQSELYEIKNIMESDEYEREERKVESVPA